MKKLITVLLIILPVKSLFIFNIYYISLLLSILPLLYIIQMYRYININRMPTYKPLYPYVVLFIFVFTFSSMMFSNISLNYLRPLLLNMLAILYMLSIMLYVKNENDIVYILKVMVYSIYVQLLVYILQIFSLLGFQYPRYSRFQGTFSGYELLAEYLGLSLIVAIGLFMYNKLRGKNNYFLFITILVLVYLGISTVTRGFIGSFIAVVFGYVLLGVLYTKTKLRYLALGVIISILLFLVYGTIGKTSQVIQHNYERILQLEYKGDRAFNRASMYKTAFSLIDDMDITGYGSEMMTEYNAAMGGIYSSPHSLYLYVMLQGGYISTILLILMLLKLLHVAYANVRNSDSISPFKSISIALLILWIYWVISQAKIDVIRQPSYFAIIMVYMGITNAIYRINRSTINNKALSSSGIARG